MQKTDRLAELVQVFQDKGVDAEIAEAPTGGLVGKGSEPIVQLSEQNIDRIWLYERRSASYWGIKELVLHFTVVLEKPLTRESRQALSATSRPIKQNKVLGLFGGRTVGVRWVGGSLADSLNQDAHLLNTLRDCFRGLNLAIEIRPQGRAMVDITSSDAFFNRIVWRMITWPLHKNERKEWQEPRWFERFDLLEVFDRIGKHVRDVASLY